MVAQTQKVLFLCNCCSTTLVPSLNDQICCNGATGRAKEAEPLPRWLKGCRGHWMEAQWSPLWSLNGRYRSAKGGTMVVQGRQKRCSNWYTVFTTVRIFYGATNGRPLYIHSATMAMCVPSSCLLRATCERPTSSATVLNMLKTSRRPWRPWRCLNVLCTTIERQRQPFCLLSAFNGDLASFVVAQWRQKGRSPCVKGVLAMCGFFMSKIGTPLTKFGCVTPYPRGCFKEAILRTAK